MHNTELHSPSHAMVRKRLKHSRKAFLQSFKRWFIKDNDAVCVWNEMRPPCELVVKHVLPAFRSLVARELVENHHLSQIVVAERMGTTQAAVSLYLDSKRGDKTMKQLVAVPTIRKMAHEVARGLATGKFSSADSMTKFCELCVALRKSNVICELHHDRMTLPESCNICPQVPSHKD